MAGQKRGRGRPRGTGPYGRLRAKIGQMRIGETILVCEDDMTEAAKAYPGDFAGTVMRCAERDIPGSKFSRINNDGTVFVRREA